MRKSTARPTISRARSAVVVSEALSAEAVTLPFAQHGDPVGDGHHLAQLVGDKDHRFALLDHGTQDGKEVFDLLGRQDGGGLVHDQDVCAPVEHFQDLDALLLAHRKLPDLGARIDVQAKSLGQFGHLLFILGQAHEKAGLVQPQQDVLGHALRGDQHKVLVHHADARLDGIARGAQIDGLTVDPNRALFGPVEAGQHVHQRALAGAILAQQGVDLAGAHVEIDVVVGHDARESFGDALHLYGVGGSFHRL